MNSGDRPDKIEDAILTPEGQKHIEAFRKFPKKATGRPSKEYSVVIKMCVMVLKDAGMPIATIAREMKINEKTVRSCLLDKSVKVDTSNMDELRKQFAARIAEIVDKMLFAANTDQYVRNLMEAKNGSMVLALCQLVDKVNLLTGKATSIVETRDIADSVQKQIKEIEDLEKALRAQIVNTPDPKGN